MPCQVTSYRGATDIGCQRCIEDDGHRCDEEGSVFPRAAPGFFAESSFLEALGRDGTTTVMPCLPFQACLGTCASFTHTAHLLQQESTEESTEESTIALSFEDCAAGLGAAAWCTILSSVAFAT